MNVAYLLIGGNLGDRLHFLKLAKEGMEKFCGKITNVSSIYETAAWGIENQASFLNQAIEIETKLDASRLLQCLLQIETSLGRVRKEKYGARHIDIDIIFFNEEVIRLEELTIPHPQMQNRRFVLLPLHEIAPEKKHPLLHKSIQQLLTECEDNLDVRKFV